MHVLSLANPVAPLEIGHWPPTLPNTVAEYVHDCVPIGNRLYASSIYEGIQRVLDFTDPALPTEIASWTYAGAFSHNSWPDTTGNTLYVTDEVNGEPLKIFDISNLAAPTLRNAITSNPKAIVHNAHVRGNELYLSNYTEGIRILDISDPLHPAEFASADSWPGLSGNFYGVWEVCPFFPSGTVIASDMQSGLYVYRPVRDYGIIRAVVTTPDLSSADGGARATTPGGALMSAASGVEVYLTTQGDSLTSPADGIVQFAPSPGSHTVKATKFGYYDATATVNVTTGSRDTVQLAMVSRPRVDYSGTIRDAVTDAPLEGAEVNFLYTGVHAHTDAAGAFALPQFPEDTYRVEVRAPGHIPAIFTLALDATLPPMNLKLPPTATWDAMEAASGWATGGAGTGDNATTGQWIRVEPLGTGAALINSAPRSWNAPLRVQRKPGPGLFHEGHEEDGATPGDVQPEFDRSPAPGTMCFVTGQGSDPTSIGEADVDNGKTSLTSPALDLSAMTDPVIGYWRWFYASGGDDDWFAVQVSPNNGTTWIAVDTLRGSQAHWQEQAVHVKNYIVSPGAQTRIRFIAADQNPGTVVEAGIDDVVTYDGVNAPLVDLEPSRPGRTLRFRAAFPNPSNGTTRFTLELPTAGPATVEVLDVTGRRVRLLHKGETPAGVLTLSWDGRDEGGQIAPSGFYFARALAGTTRAETRFARIR